MAHSGKTITFATDLLPNEDGVYNLGNTNKKWNIFGTVTGNATNVTGTVAIENGGTGATTAAEARANLGTPPYIQGVFYGTCTTAQGTKAKQVILVNGEGFTLSTGAMIAVKFTNASAASTMTLSISVDNGTTYGEAKNLYQYGTTLMSSGTTINGWAAGAIVIFIYDGTGWERVYWYNTTYDLSYLYSTAGASRVAESATNGGIGLHRYSLQMMTINYAWSSIASKDSTATTNTPDNNKIVSTAEFLIGAPILYQYTNANCAPGGSINADGYTGYALDLRYSTGTATNAGGGLTIQRPVYLVGTLTGASTFKLDQTKWWTQTLPTSSNDTKIYIYLGMAYSATNIYLSPVHPIYWYRNGELQLYNNYALTTSNLVANSETGNYARPIWFSYHDGTNIVNTQQGYNTNFTYNPNTSNLNFTDNATITVNAAKTLGINTTTGSLTLSSTTAALTISTTTGALEAKSTGSGTVKLTGTTGAMTISTTTGAITMQTNGTSGGNIVIKNANAGTINIQSVKSSVSLNAATTMSISGTQGTAINSGSNYATLFKINNIEYGEFNKNGMFQLNDTGTQNTHKLYVNGNSAFNGKISFGAQASNAITEKAYMVYNTTDNSIDFIFP